MNFSQIIGHYSNEKIQKIILETGKNREIAGSFEDGSYFSRPDTLIYPKDIVERVKRGIVAFHCSVEHWTNPMQLSSQLREKELNNLRSSFDIIIDIDSKAKLEHAAITARTVCDFLKDLGISPTLKFSGNRGFHIAVASNAFPREVDFKKASLRYPEIPQAIANYIREKIKDRLLERLIDYEGGVAALVKTVDSVSELSPFQFVDIEKGWGSRHLFRMPYSLHHKSWLASIPLKVEDLKNFKKEMAQPNKISDAPFLVNKNEEATELMLQALDWHAKHKKEEKPKEVRKIIIKTKIPEKFFPPCIKKILDGLKDGKKRSLFTIAAFLRQMNWNDEEIEKRIREWNSKNYDPIKDRYISTQLKWHFRQNRNLMPPNSDSDTFYGFLGMKHICGKNPVNYAFREFKKNKSPDGLGDKIPRSVNRSPHKQ